MVLSLQLFFVYYAVLGIVLVFLFCNVSCGVVPVMWCWGGVWVILAGMSELCVVWSNWLVWARLDGVGELL